MPLAPIRTPALVVTTIAQALDLRDIRGRPIDKGLPTAPRHQDALLAKGSSDRQVAEALYISPKTVGTHGASILDKLGQPSRAAVVAYVHLHGLV